MRVIAGAFFLVVALTLVMAAGAFAQITPQGNSSTNNMTTNTTSTHPTATTTNTTGTDPTSTSPTTHTPTTSTAPMAPAADCASEIAGMNAVLKALPLSERTSLKGSGQLPAIPCTGYHYATDFTIVPDASPPTPAAAPQAQDSSTQIIPQT
jgi:hypothetical protein